jgi:Fe-Mn family superoxide dismutase
VPYEVPPLAYAYDALEPTLDETTMRLHHDKHRQAYVDKANVALEGTEWADRPVDEMLRNLSSLPADKQAALRDNGGGHANQTIFWESMSPDGGGGPKGELREAIAATFGSFDDFTAQFEADGVGQFGSGRTWLVLDDGSLQLIKTPYQDSPVLAGQAVLGNDVWEHAYHLTYQNRRLDYLKAWWNTVDWGIVAARYGAARS